MVAELHVFDVVGDCIEAFCFLHHFVSGRENEFRILIDKLLDQPWAGDAVNLDVFSGNPLHLFLLLLHYRQERAKRSALHQKATTATAQSCETSFR